ncbi:hypothetical protein TTHERM_00672150 (macronuclear) [Tetrahymena thermophila SB210]|uniref:Uncharacterized protein n=1 Tax=Tetrahymena thermophila (strain SB210) TaxID=312017 RepID=Q23E40_TETTS|nr:hypothetical protein TTHERM_00672150 [Tetrahymena thermophila SB210]EAR94747.1 hypothetical protein TTHERM_00672150 [Tetrahymena thermophila SB210]|eukprot:XP_001014992.1 hypothetical protein TTHERM_00672150 [Tetrahymena thermophila SB210]
MTIYRLQLYYLPNQLSPRCKLTTGSNASKYSTKKYLRPSETDLKASSSESGSQSSS